MTRKGSISGRSYIALWPRVHGHNTTHRILGPLSFGVFSETVVFLFCSKGSRIVNKEGCTIFVYSTCGNWTRSITSLGGVMPVFFFASRFDDQRASIPFLP